MLYHLHTVPDSTAIISAPLQIPIVFTGHLVCSYFETFTCVSKNRLALKYNLKLVIRNQKWVIEQNYLLNFFHALFFFLIANSPIQISVWDLTNFKISEEAKFLVSFLTCD